MSIIKGEIPTIDLSSEEHRQVIVDREKGRYLGHVSTVLLSDNSTIIAVYVLGHGRGQAIMKRSQDGGKTWNNPISIVSHKDAYLAEAGVLYSPDKRQLAIILRENTRKYNSFVSWSNDEGETWSKPIEVSKELTGDRHNICYSPDGRVVITFRDTSSNSLTRGDWVVWVGKYDDIINGGSGEYRIRLMKNYYRDDCGYSGLELLPDGTFVATTYGHWVENEAQMA